jgi:hypothetical protein
MTLLRPNFRTESSAQNAENGISGLQISIKFYGRPRNMIRSDFKLYPPLLGEGNRPMSIFRDKYSEELMYPGIFLGQKRLDNTNKLTKVHYSEICKSELRRTDLRAVMCVENIIK